MLQLNSKYKKSSLYLLIVIIFFLSGCTNPEEQYPFSFTPPEEQNMDREILSQMISYINEETSGIHSLLLLRNGHLVKEYYWGERWGNEVPHDIHSCTKSVISMLVGIAIDKNMVDLNDPVIDFFPDKVIENLTNQKQRITIRNLLEMRSGLDWDESLDYYNTSNPFNEMRNSNDWVQYVLDKPMESEPGTDYAYNSGGSHLLSAIIQEASNMTTKEFAESYLFEPLGIKPGNWAESPQGIAFGGSGLTLRPRDMIKLGYLALNNGSWFESEIISEEWIIASTRFYRPLDENYTDFYGFQWWIYPNQYDYYSYSAIGILGQRITVIPDQNIVLVLTGNCETSYADVLLKDYIIPSIID